MKGLIHIYCGDGKGKTTAATGLAVRAAGCGMKVLLVQFLKGQETGELRALAHIPGITVLRGKASEKFTFQMDERELQQTYDLNTKNLLTAVEQARAGACDLLVLDEVMGALSAHRRGFAAQPCGAKAGAARACDDRAKSAGLAD